MTRGVPGSGMVWNKLQPQLHRNRYSCPCCGKEYPFLASKQNITGATRICDRCNSPHRRKDRVALCGGWYPDRLCSALRQSEGSK